MQYTQAEKRIHYVQQYTVLMNLEYTRHSQAVDVRVQTAQLLAQDGRQLRQQRK